LKPRSTRAYIERLTSNDDAPSDRHVLAPAVAADCELIVTFDLADFPAPACEPLGMKANHPDELLPGLKHLNPTPSALRSNSNAPTRTHAGQSMSSRAHSPQRCAALRRCHPPR
jgi:hypothetical protein